MFPGALQGARVLARVEVGMDQLDQAVEIFRRDRVVFLVEVVHVPIEDLDEKLDRDSSVHAGICDAERTLETF